MKIFNSFKSHEINGLPNELKSVYIKEYFDNNDESILLVCNSLYEANKFYQSLSIYNNVLFFPMDDFLTSEALASSPELMVRRLETIKELTTNNKYIVITNLMGFLRFLPSRFICR